MTNGTPKTLALAIINGQMDAADSKQDKVRETYTLEKHIKDFLAQHFAVAMLKNPESGDAFKALFERVTKE